MNKKEITRYIDAIMKNKMCIFSDHKIDENSSLEEADVYMSVLTGLINRENMGVYFVDDSDNEWIYCQIIDDKTNIKTVEVEIDFHSVFKLDLDEIKTIIENAIIGDNSYRYKTIRVKEKKEK